jgi:hypothetical protein
VKAVADADMMRRRRLTQPGRGPKKYNAVQHGVGSWNRTLWVGAAQSGLDARKLDHLGPVLGQRLALSATSVESTLKPGIVHIPWRVLAGFSSDNVFFGRPKGV